MLTRPSQHSNVHALPGSSFAAPPSAGLFDLRAFISRLRRRARVIALTAAGSLALAVLALVIISPRYTATAILLADPRQQRVVPSEAVLSGIGSDAAAVESQSSRPSGKI
jgi:polysaccharide biosynthesis transport protein